MSKRIPVLKVLQAANNMLKSDFVPLKGPNQDSCQDNSTDAERGRAFRQGVASVLEYILTETANYNGYSHLDKVERNIRDDSRREYYYSDEMNLESNP
jgi:hypothetical protein